jgi:hypothetical protein
VECFNKTFNKQEVEWKWSFWKTKYPSVQRYEYYELDSMTFNIITKGIAVSVNWCFMSIAINSHFRLTCVVVII